jgi:hypothetical protein
MTLPGTNQGFGRLAESVFCVAHTTCLLELLGIRKCGLGKTR